MEFAKALLQVGVVSVAGTLLSVLVFDHQRRSGQRKDAAAAAEKQLLFRDDLLKSTLARIAAAYASTKRARRTARALGLRRTTGTISVRLQRYDECMAEVNDAQLELEAIKSDVNTTKLAYPSADLVASNLRKMEQYLGELIEEYEGVRAQLPDESTDIDLSRVPRFADFVGPSTGSEFSTRFSESHSNARGAIRGDLLHLNLPSAS